ncbi:hypothetical protein ACFVMC_00225 [Nocardia sp. NPDC127579]|uniref:hypothetical protein n=1 Tax=Nocardia sp. NPDC127579 TaxID=3345402 RepID=UPI0036326A2A
MTDTNKSLEDIRAAITKFSEQVELVRTSPEALDIAFDAYLTAFNPIGIAVTKAAEAVDMGAVSDSILAEKEHCKKLIQELLQKLQTAVDAMDAPIALAQSGLEWAEIYKDASEARNKILVGGDLERTWSGTAANTYLAKHTTQAAAAESALNLCEKVRQQMTAASDAAWKYYSGLAQDLVDFFVDFVAALTKIMSGISAPWGVSDLIDALTKIAKKVVEWSLETGETKLKILAVETSIGVEITNPKTFDGNKWPLANSQVLSIDKPDSERWSAQ